MHIRQFREGDTLKRLAASYFSLCTWLACELAVSEEFPADQLVGYAMVEPHITTSFHIECQDDLTLWMRSREDCPHDDQVYYEGRQFVYVAQQLGHMAVDATLHRRRFEPPVVVFKIDGGYLSMKAIPREYPPGITTIADPFKSLENT